MSDTKFCGKGWESKHGINISLEIGKLLDIPPDKYGNVYIKVVKRKEQDPKSKATHFVAVDDYRYQEKENEPF